MSVTVCSADSQKGMRTHLLAFILLAALPLFADSRIHLTLDTSEADQVLAILALRQQNKPIVDADWQKLFATEPYRRLKQREQKIGEQFHDPSVAFTDDDFKKFVLYDALLARTGALRATLDRWKRADLQASATRVLAYLPDNAVIRAKVYPVIKPQTNTFVWDTSTDPAIFLYLDPEVPAAKFENTVAHELHHIGIGSVGPVYDSKIADLPFPAHAAAEWMAAFAEGQAMLAAAGGPDADPHAASNAKQRARWEHDLANFDSDLRTMDNFFSDVLAGKFPTKEAVEEKAGSFFGDAQGPWYTVGYRMSVMVEKRFGRPALISTMLDPRCLLVLYNRAASEENSRGSHLPLWSESVLSGVHASSCPVPK